MAPPDLSAQGFTPYGPAGTPLAGVTTQIYRTAPNLPAAPKLTLPAGWEAVQPLAPGAGARYYFTARNPIGGIVPPPAVVPPTPTPIPTPTPPLAPVRTVNKAPIISVGHTADQTIKDQYVKGFAQNIVCQNYAGGLLVDNVVSVDSYDASQFQGQGIYLENIAGNVVIQNSYFGFNGRPRVNPIMTPTLYKHCIYANDNIGSLVVQNCILSNAANAGVQSRALKGTVITGNVILDCGTAVLAIQGGATVTGNLIYGGQFYFDGANPTGNSALRTYWQMLCRDNLVLSRPGQAAAPAWPNHPTLKGPYPQGGLNVGGQWVHEDPVWTPPAGYPDVPEYLSGSNNRISSDWPGGLTTGPTLMPGWSECAPGVAFDYTSILAAVEAGGSVIDAIGKLRAALVPSD